jgi:HTH-type transcriptional regulator / antitoxin HigA
MLRHLMAVKAANQAEIHQATGIPKSTISEVPAGKKPFSRQMIRKLAGYFEVDVAVLPGGFVSVRLKQGRRLDLIVMGSIHRT